MLHKTSISSLHGKQTSVLNLDDIQGDILFGLQKFHECFAFFEIKEVDSFKGILKKDILKRVTTTRKVVEREKELKDLKESKAEGNSHRLKLVGLNIGFSNAGMAKLVPGSDLGDVSFAAGAKARAADRTTLQFPNLPPTLPVNDPIDDKGNLTTWKPAFLNASIDGVFLITGGTKQAVDGELKQVVKFLGASAVVVAQEWGETRPGSARGHEHFGWLDGISQPGVIGLNDPLPGQDMLDPGLFIFGDSTTPPPKLPLLKNGSFMVFRRLQQLVPELNQFLVKEGRSLGLDPVMLGARIVGRWKSGAPLDSTPLQDDPNVGVDSQQNNNFDFETDQDQRRCPFSAHIRKANPRKDVVKTGLDPHRIIRQGIPFGPELLESEETSGKTQEERGLLFVCYQTSIHQQFEFVQGTWSNNPEFVSSAFPKTRPDGSVVHVGLDPLIGQLSNSATARQSDEPIPNFPTGNVRSNLTLPNNFILPTGGGYFFVPSISALSKELTS